MPSIVLFLLAMTVLNPPHTKINNSHINCYVIFIDGRPSIGEINVMYLFFQPSKSQSLCVCSWIGRWKGNTTNIQLKIGSQVKARHFNFSSMFSFFVGPIVGGLARRFSCRIVVMIGGVLLCLGMVLASQMTSVWSMSIILVIFCGML